MAEATNPTRILDEHDPEKLAGKLEDEHQQIRNEMQEENQRYNQHPDTPPPYPLEDN